jgi:raffinose/stachyose/melibiose transport system substrate-binding protein
MGAFKPPVKAEGDTCYISDHTDIGIGLNAASPNADAARPSWLGRAPNSHRSSATRCRASSRLSKTTVELEDPLAQEFVELARECESTIRSTYQILSRGTPNLENETWGASVAAIKGNRDTGGPWSQAAGRPDQLVRAAAISLSLSPKSG